MRHDECECRELGLDEVMPGSVLADEVLDAQGKVLLPKGSAVTEATLESLRRRDILTLPVRVATALSADQETARRERIARRLQHIFRNAGDGAPARELQQQVSEYRLGQRS